MRKKLIEILSVPIYPHEQADPTEVVADYLLDNDVLPVVRCKDCKHYKPQKPYPSCNGQKKYCCRCAFVKVRENDFCSYGERRSSDDER